MRLCEFRPVRRILHVCHTRHTHISLIVMIGASMFHHGAELTDVLFLVLALVLEAPEL